MSIRPASSAARSVAPADTVTGRRGAARLRLSIPAKLISLFATQRCILIDISRGGAQVGLAEPLRLGEDLCVEIAGLEPFGTVVRCDRGLHGGVNGIAFEDWLSDEEVLSVRRFSENFLEVEQARLRREARKWITGA